ncbi:hypothetical protein BC829DRAFT_438239 [Chytridium lagenaria]|nr:hypothetical protein BC829DRAFT_438239 [Chytridium lagenaria]
MILTLAQEHHFYIQEARTYLKTHLEILKECAAPIPFVDPNAVAKVDIKDLPYFPSIQQVSLAFTLNFWQHHSFETAARKNWKSAIINALLCLVIRWRRRDTLQTTGFTGIIREVVTTKQREQHHKVRMIIIDEISMTSQELLGAADKASRALASYPDKAAKHRIFGGKHVLMFGDLLNSCQLERHLKNKVPPVTGVFGTSFFKEPSSAPTPLQEQGYEVFRRINFTVFLTQNMRQRGDPAFTKIVRCLRYGHLSDSDLALLNTRYINDPDFTAGPLITDVARVGYFHPMEDTKIDGQKISNDDETGIIVAKGAIATIVGIQLHEDDKRLEHTGGIRGSDVVLYEDFPTGVIPITWPNESSFTVTVDQFPMIPFFTCTPEKLQGTDSSGKDNAEDISDYFTPTEETVLAMQYLMSLVMRPTYASDDQWQDFIDFRTSNNAPNLE